jgi:hypothetical protein
VADQERARGDRTTSLRVIRNRLGRITSCLIRAREEHHQQMPMRTHSKRRQRSSVNLLRLLGQIRVDPSKLHSNLSHLQYQFTCTIIGARERREQHDGDRLDKRCRICTMCSVTLRRDRPHESAVRSGEVRGARGGGGGGGGGTKKI